MEQYIPKSALIAEIKNLENTCKKCSTHNSYEEGLKNGILMGYKDALHKINALEGKEAEEHKQPEYSCLKTVYWCGKKPHWNIGNMLAYYEFDSDIEGECVLGKVINVELDEEQRDWLYTFEDGSVYDEQSLLEDQTYKKN